VDTIGGFGGETGTSSADFHAGDGLSRINKGKGKATEDEVAAQEVGASSGSETMKDDGVREV
jgi:hypothetical protein